MELGLTEIAEHEQEIVDGVGRLSRVPRVQALELTFDRVNRSRIEQFAQLGISKELAQLRLVDGKRLSPPLRQWRVAAVDKTGDVAEKQRRRKW